MPELIDQMHDDVDADLGMEAFILSGYPIGAEGDLFARYVLPHLTHAPLLPRTR